MDNSSTIALGSTPTTSGARSASGPGLWERIAGGHLPLDTSAGSAAAFVVVLFQVAIVYWVLHRFKIENELFRFMIAAAFGAFAVHHFLPSRFQERFFMAFSMLLTAYCLGLQRAVWTPTLSLERAGTLFAIGAVLIGICRLPIGYYSRVLALLAAVGVLALFRASIFQFGPLDAIWPILGGMFMYRLACYLYDYEHEKVKSSWTRAFSYFFLFPNVWLFVFPMIDYKTFGRERFTGQAALIYQRGLNWMMRGVVQLVIWRLIYYQYYVDPAKIASGSDLAQFMLSNVGLYLRVTGQFHFAIGLMHLFGFVLPECNRRYFLATGFVDYWRRANIYMKDFLMKLSFYPFAVRCKKFGPVGSVVAAIAGTFVVTWFLHSYQWFWIRGVFPLTVKDAVFWALLGGGVIINSVYDIKWKKKPAKGDSVTAQAIRQSLSAGITFLITTTLWSIWTCDSLTQWAGIWQFASGSTATILATSFALVFVLYYLLESAASPFKRGPGPNPLKATLFPLRQAVLLCLIPAAILIAGTTDQVLSRIPPAQREMVNSMFWNTPNKSGEEFLVRGYYEGLMDTARFSPALEGAMATQPKDWMLLEQTTAVKVTNDLRTRALQPNVKLTINGVPFETNRWSMRDQDYELKKPAGTTRFVLLGSSITMGWNVPKESTFEAIVEKEWNKQSASGPVEILNFAVNGYSIASLAEQIEAEVPRFEPDAAIIVSHPEDPGRAIYMLAKSLAAGYQPKEGYIAQIVKEAGISPGDPRNRMEQKLAPYKTGLTQWAYESIVKTCRENGIEPWLVFLPGVLQRSTGEIDLQLVTMAEKAGFKVIPLHDVYASEADRGQLAVAPWDAHPNEKGHRLVAARILELARPAGLFPWTRPGGGKTK